MAVCVSEIGKEMEEIVNLNCLFERKRVSFQIVILFSSTEGRKMNTKVGLHTYPPPPQTFRALPEDLGR